MRAHVSAAEKVSACRPSSLESLGLFQRPLIQATWHDACLGFKGDVDDTFAPL